MCEAVPLTRVVANFAGKRPSEYPGEYSKKELLRRLNDKLFNKKLYKVLFKIGVDSMNEKQKNKETFCYYLFRYFADSIA